MSSGYKAMGLVQWLQLLFLAAVWGGSFFFIKIAVGQVGPFSIVFWRCLLGALLLYLALRVSGQNLPHDWRDWGRLLLLALMTSTVPFTLISWGEQYIDSGLASMFNATTPLFTVVILHLLRDERLTRSRVAGVALGLAGVGVLVGPAALAGLDEHLLAQLAVLTAAMLYGVAAIYARYLKHLPTLAVATGQLACTALITLPLALYFDQPWRHALPGLATVLSLAALGLLSTALAFAVYYRLLASAGPANTTLVTFLIPASATLLGVLVLGEQIGLRHISGMTLIALGLVLIDKRLPQLLRSRIATSPALK